MTSTRLPGKVLLPAAGRPLLAHLVERLKRVPSIDEIVIATTTNGADDPIVELARTLGVTYFRGSEDDVLGRVLSAAKNSYADTIVEITADCPAIDPSIVQRCIETFIASGADYVSNILVPTYPWGMDTQVFATETLAQADTATTDDPAAREHVSLYIYEHPERFTLVNVAAPPELTWPELHIELDTPEDYELIRTIFDELYPQHPDFALGDIISLLRRKTHISRINEHIQRNAAR